MDIFIKYKSETFECFKNLKSLVEMKKIQKLSASEQTKGENSHQMSLVSFVIFMELKGNSWLPEHLSKMG